MKIPSRKYQMMKALSLLQPWATLVVLGYKTIETRSWSTAWRGTILIHASKGKAGEEVCDLPAFKKYIPDFNALPFGAILGEVQVVDVIRIAELAHTPEGLEKLTLEERAFGDYRGGRFAWLLEEPLQFGEPIPAKGALGLWDAG